RHLDHRCRRALRPAARPPAGAGARAADGAVPAGPGRALPHGRRGGRSAGCRGRRRDARGGPPSPAPEEVLAMTDVEVPAEPVAPARTPAVVARGLLKTMRPRQWVKNVLVFAAPFVGGDLLTPGIVPKLLIAFVAFSLAASGIYLVNDAKDVAADRAHPTKRFRPIAAGVVSPRLAIAVAVVLLAASVAVSLLASVQLVVVLAVYVAVQLAYCFWLKHQAVLDICIVASGFLLRAIAGGAA